MSKDITGKRDWLILILYVALIYATIPIMPGISAFFSSLLGRNFALAANSFLVAIIVIVFAVIFKYSHIQKRPISYIAAAALFAVYLAILLFATPIIAEKTHLLEYGFLSYLALRAVGGTRSHVVIASEAKQSLYVILIVILVGSIDELIQKFTPGRYFELRDVVLNIISGILGLGVLKLLKPE